MRCVILNRNYPPRPGMTGHAAAELAGYLSEHGVEVHIVTVGGTGVNARLDHPSHPDVRMHIVRNLYDGKNKILRLIASLIEGRNMAAKAAALGIAPMITLTDPPLLNYWVARIGRRRRIPWIYWSMDLYPEAFVAAGLAKSGGWIYRHIKRVLRTSVPRHRIALGPRQAAAMQHENAAPVPTSILPCGIVRLTAESRRAEPARPTGQNGRDKRPRLSVMSACGKTTFCYIGNLGQAHDPGFIEAVIRALDPARHHFFLAVYGVHAARVLRYAASFAHVTILPAVEPADFELIDIHLVSLEPPWDHVCVPSKAVSAVCAGACLLLCASDQGDNWNLLHDAAWRIAPGPGMADEVARFVNSLTPAAVAEKRRRTHAIREQLEAMRTRAFGEIWHAMRAMLNFEF